MDKLNKELLDKEKLKLVKQEIIKLLKANNMMISAGHCNGPYVSLTIKGQNNFEERFLNKDFY